MNDEAASFAARLKRRRVAASLGMFMPPVGYAYAGRFGRGVAAFVGAAAVIWLMSHLPFGLLDYRPIAAVAAISHFLACVAFCCDLDRIVKRGEDRTGRWYQGGVVYCLLFAAWIAFGVAAFKVNETTLLKAQQVCHGWPMEPAIRPGDCVLVVPNGNWRRGDIVAHLRGPVSKLTLGRVVGLPGDVVAIRDGNPVVNGTPLHQAPAPLPPQDALSLWIDGSTRSFTETNGDRSYRIVRRNGPTSRFQEVAERRVPDGHLYVLGDERDFANDSRAFGDIPTSQAVGKPVMVTRSADWSRLGEPVR